jgi:isopentenyl diphosphate isomerase/L-lactate dehydrogenase-like FMN-dependent dehydrogenase
MSEEAYKAIHERAQANLEKLGKSNLLDMLHPVQPGTIVARGFYERIGLRLRLLCTQAAETTFHFLGKELRSPIMVAPMSDNSLGNHYPDAFRAISEGANQFGTQYWIGDCTDAVWKEVAFVAPSSIRIVKPWKDRERTLTSLKLAEETGAFAVGMDFESGFYADDCEPQSAEGLAAYVKATRLPFIVKAVGSVETARISRDAGAAAIIVTSHGGSLGPSWGHPLEILPDIVHEVGGDVLVLSESGVRHGEDVLKLLAFGAEGVLMGRGLLLGLFADGAAGVTALLETVNGELKRTMVLAGCPDLASINDDILIPR